MTPQEAIAFLETKALISLELANAPRGKDRISQGIAQKHRDLATAIAVVLALIPAGAK